MPEPVTKPQIRKLFAMAKQLGMDDVDLRGIVKNVTGSDHVSTITKAQAGQLIDYLTDRARGDYRPAAASRQQLYMIRKLAAELGWNDNPNRLAGFIKRQTGVDHERWLDAAGAWRVIEGLKKILNREKQKQGNKNSQKGDG
jgi:hypothetical protein